MIKKQQQHKHELLNTRMRMRISTIHHSFMILKPNEIKKKKQNEMCF